MDRVEYIVTEEINRLRMEVMICDEKLSESYIKNFSTYGIRRYVNARIIRELSDFLNNDREKVLVNQQNEAVVMLARSKSNGEKNLDLYMRLDQLIDIKVRDEISKILKNAYKED